MNREYEQDVGADEGELLAEGWTRRFVADEPRLSEAIELYLSLDFEVALRALSEEDLSGPGCTACFRSDPSRYRVVYTRSRGSHQGKPNIADSFETGNG